MRDSEKDGRYRPRCPSCGWHDTRISPSHGLLDRLLSTLSLVPYRCRTCGARFYRLRHPAHTSAQEHNDETERSE